MIKKAVWSFIVPFGDPTPLQKMMLLASPFSLKKVEPNIKTVLYTNSEIKEQLESLGDKNPFDQIIEDLKIKQLQKTLNFRVWWDLSKWISLSQEKERVLYVDYDVIFSNPFLDQLGTCNWVWCLECMDGRFQDSHLIPWDRLSLDAKQIVPKYGDIAYNSGILVLNPEEIQICTAAFRYYASKLSNLSYMESISITQALSGFVATPSVFKYLRACEHYMGGDKLNVGSPEYTYIKTKIVREYPRLLLDNTIKAFLNIPWI